MIAKEFILLNPFRVMGYENDDITPEGGLGAVSAQAGVGKTALLVQLALNAMLRGKKVLHISLEDPVNKVTLWYHELFHKVVGQLGVEKINDTWEGILPIRFIMTFKVEGFNLPKLKERLTDLIVQNIFLPQIIIIDGLKFDDVARETISNLKSLAEKHSLRLWFTVHARPNEEKGFDDIPPSLLPFMDLFDVVFKLQTEKGEICIKPMNGKSNAVQPLYLDPATMLIKSETAR
ncbi:MAG: AAA family ATPase [Syntrophales bacterium LBB04]|nr:AAA family ATPase [Syntrophales bacterium LBB04]